MHPITTHPPLHEIAAVDVNHVDAFIGSACRHSLKLSKMALSSAVFIGSTQCVCYVEHAWACTVRAPTTRCLDVLFLRFVILVHSIPFLVNRPTRNRCPATRRESHLQAFPQRSRRFRLDDHFANLGTRKDVTRTNIHRGAFCYRVPTNAHDTERVTKHRWKNPPHSCVGSHRGQERDADGSSTATPLSIAPGARFVRRNRLGARKNVLQLGPRMPDNQPRSTPSDPARPRSPSHAERCRTMAIAARSATLSTIARDPPGFPFGTLVTLAVDHRGRPILLLSQLAEHTQNLSHNSNTSILLTEVAPAGTSPLTNGRVTLLGPCRPVPEAERNEVSAIFLAAHPEAAQYASFKDFAYYRIDPIALRYVGGFGRMSWVNAEEYFAAEPDPIAPHVEGILEHMNTDHADAVLAYARALAGISDAVKAIMTAVDRYGFDLRIDTPAGRKNARIAFETPMRTTEDVRIAMVKLVKAARKALEG